MSLSSPNFQNGFEQIALLEKVSRAIDTDWIVPDVDFSQLPNKFLGSIRVQIITTTPTIVKLTMDGTVFHPLNNNIPIIGIFSFPLILSKNSKLNFQHSTATQDISIYIGED